MLLAKQIDENNWVLFEHRRKVGNIVAQSKNSLLVSKNQQRFVIQNFSDLGITEEKIKKSEVENPFDYPINVQKIFNNQFDIKRKLPIFTTKEKSQCFYCAGWYLVMYPAGAKWVLCPKLLTLLRYEFDGPHKNKLTV